MGPSGVSIEGRTEVVIERRLGRKGPAVLKPELNEVAGVTSTIIVGGGYIVDDLEKERILTPNGHNQPA